MSSQGLRLHYVDWGNEAAPPLILVHGGLDHCRNWDAIARELQPHFHVVAPDLRGHGDSEWAKGSSYSLVDHVYDLTRLIRFAGAAGCRHCRSLDGRNGLAGLCRNLPGAGVAPCRAGRRLSVGLPTHADP